DAWAGVLRALLDDSDAFAQVARRALEICHFDPESGADRGRAERATEDCEAACYDCLMHYGNQPDHRHLDRKKIQALLLALTHARAETSVGGGSRGDHLTTLKRMAGAGMERRLLGFPVG